MVVNVSVCIIQFDSEEKSIFKTFDKFCCKLIVLIVRRYYKTLSPPVVATVPVQHPKWPTRVGLHLAQFDENILKEVKLLSRF